VLQSMRPVHVFAIESPCGWELGSAAQPSPRCRPAERLINLV
jgi:hypothetical protein